MKPRIFGKFRMEAGANDIPLLHSYYNFSHFAFRIFMFYCSQNHDIFALFFKKILKIIYLFYIYFYCFQNSWGSDENSLYFFLKKCEFYFIRETFNLQENKIRKCNNSTNLGTEIISVGFYIQSSENPVLLSLLHHLIYYKFKHFYGQIFL